MCVESLFQVLAAILRTSFSSASKNSLCCCVGRGASEKYLFSEKGVSILRWIVKAASGTLRVVLSNSGNGVWVVADAIRVAPA